MTASRSLLVLRTRWWVVVAVTVIGAGVAFLSTLVTNNAEEQAFEGVAPISVDRVEGESDSAYGDRLATATAEAETTVSSELTNSNLSVSSNPDAATIQFVATAETPAEAVAEAVALRAIYQDSRPTESTEDQLAPVLESVATEIVAVQDELAELSRLTTDEVVALQRQALNEQLEAATESLVNAQARLLDQSLTAEVRAEFELQASDAEATIEAIGPLLSRLPSSTGAVAETQLRLEVVVLQRRLSALESQYVATALRRSEGSTDSTLTAPFVSDLASAAISPLLSVLVGLVSGALLGSLAVIASDRLSDPVRSVDDVPGLTAIRVSRRPRKLVGSIGWYQSAGGHARRADIQALRARIDRSIGRGKIVLIAGVDAPSRDVIDMGIDLASSVAVTGRSVLFIDTRLTESAAALWDPGPSLAEILLAQDGAVPDRSTIKRLLWDRAQVVPNLMVVAAGSMVGDPVDALAGLNFGAVVEEARDLVDLVILATGDVANPMSEAVAGRARLAVIAAQKDRTRRKDLTAGAASLEQLGVSVAAVAILAGSSATKQSTKGSKSIPPTSKAAADLSARHLDRP